MVWAAFWCGERLPKTGQVGVPRVVAMEKTCGAEACLSRIISIIYSIVHSDFSAKEKYIYSIHIIWFCQDQ